MCSLVIGRTELNELRSVKQIVGANPIALVEKCQSNRWPGAEYCVNANAQLDPRLRGDDVEFWIAKGALLWLPRTPGQLRSVALEMSDI